MIHCLGNTNYDIVFEQGQVVSGTPGGSKLNTAVSLGRMHAPVTFISRVGSDNLGNLIHQFLKNNGVDTSHFQRVSGLKTNLALAFLDDAKNASYVHYGSEDKPFPDINVTFRDGDILLFGSVFALSGPSKLLTDSVLAQSEKRDVLRIYDPNMRKKCSVGDTNARQTGISRMRQAHVIKCSDEDLEGMGLTIDKLRTLLPGKYIVITRQGRSVLFFSDGIELEVAPPQMKPVSTVGAGDAFNAGVIAALHKYGVKPDNIHALPQSDWNEVIEAGVATATQVCRRRENYIAKNENYGEIF